MIASRGKVCFVTGLAFMAPAMMSCRTMQASTVKNNEPLQGAIAQMSLGQGVQLPPIIGRSDITGIAPSLAVCVTPPLASPLPPIAQGCNGATTASAAAQPAMPSLGTAPALGNPNANIPPASQTQSTGQAQGAGAVAAAPAANKPTSLALDDDAGAGAGSSGSSSMDEGDGLAPSVTSNQTVAGTQVLDSGDNDPTLPPPDLTASSSSLALDGTANTANNQTLGGSLTGDVRIITSQSDVDDVTQLSLNVGSSLPVVNGGLSSQLRNQIHDTLNHFYIVFKLEYHGRIDRIDVPVMTAQPDASHFVDVCGNRYIADRVLGGVFFGVATFDNSAKAQMSDIQTAVAGLKTSYVPGLQGGGGLQITSQMRQALSSATIQFTKIGGADQAFDLTLDGMVAASRSFICTVSQYPAPLVAYLRSYRGLAPDPVVPQESDITQKIATASKSMTTASATLHTIDGYPVFQQPALAQQTASLKSYIATLQATTDACRADPANCDTATLAKTPPVAATDLPARLPGTLTWNLNNWYYVPSAGDGVYCNFNNYTSPGRINKLDVSFRGTDLGGQASVSYQWYVAPNWLLGAYSVEHETSIGVLSPYLQNIVDGQMSNTMIADFMNKVVQPLTVNDSWAFSSCTSR